ncbi:DNA-binding protein [Marinobacterium nitratireducens]|uniref:DNA-binding protein n=1 Tax=Marinobacterium nitratireducens TaxID=518897 RepID=A0A917Z916_9GAMM|nr:XRE family transcriptional regulator [Marinobacterium nitratireducens]GGO78483.1 DNA-binding protein [Marinobacterium nitratireducens]
MKEPGQYLAQALRSRRQTKGWSLDQASRHTGVSKAMLGQIERGESSPTVATLWKIATGFGAALSDFLEPPALDDDSAVRQTDELRHRPAVDAMLVASLFPYDAALGFEMFELTLMPGYTRSSEPHAPGVIEHVVLLRGGMELLIDGQWKPLQAGDAIRFAADRPHGYRNPGLEPAVFHNLIHYPPPR